ncbi:MAG: hypothetical protein IRY87_21595, partial [Acetobacteraceae bacterium]|nr:hypothetical protein [Acetobacteraceae bacterium]
MTVTGGSRSGEAKEGEAVARAQPSSPSAAPRREPVLVDLALQGGGAHGAFTWGVLDRLLEEPWLE